MNKHTSLKRTVLMAVALGAIGATAAFAQTANTPAATDTTPTTSTGTGTPSDGGGWHHHRHRHGSVLSSTERTELKKDRDAAFAANPTLKAQDEALHQQFKTLKSQNPHATEAQFQALKTQHEALRTQLRTAIESTDPAATALFQKIDAAKAQHQHSS